MSSSRNASDRNGWLSPLMAASGLSLLGIAANLAGCASNEPLENPSASTAAGGAAVSFGAGGSALPPGAGGSVTGGSTGMGGAIAAAGGSTGGGGADAGAGGAAPVDCTIPATPPLDTSILPECPACVGKPAHCVEKSLVDAVAPGQAAQLAACNDTTVCVPDVLTATLGKYDPPDCTSIAGSAGRCLSECIGAVAALGSFLPQATCAAGEKCAPCVDPRTGADTGACTLSCDTGPTEPKVVFDRCCSDDSGICVPPEVVPENQRSALVQGDKCGAGTLCAPEQLSDSTFHPKVCDSVGGAEGRCLSTCVGLVGEQAAFLKQDVCAAGELCAPCTDPRSGAVTGACSINGDAPTEPPLVFDQACCASTGTCVPKSAVPEQFASLLPADNCTSEGTDWLCAPNIKLANLSNKFTKCQVLILGAPVPAGDPNQFGGCIPQCIADAQIAANPLTALGLAQSDCTAGWLCAPCINPLDQTRTGACD